MFEGLSGPPDQCPVFYASDDRALRKGTLLENILPDLFPLICAYWIHNNHFQARGVLRESYSLRQALLGPDDVNNCGGPYGVTIDPYTSAIIIADTNNHKIQVFNHDGQEDGKLGDPWAIAVDLEGNYVVAEGGNRRIQTFTAAGKYLRKFGWTEGPLWQPLDVKVDLNGDIICTSCGTGIATRACLLSHVAIGKGVQIFDCHGTYIRSIGPEDDELEPRGVALDRDSNIYVSEYPSRIRIFSKQGELLKSIKLTELNGTRQLVVHRDGHLLATDLSNHRVCIFG